MKGLGDQIDYGFRIYDPRVGRFLSIDPLSPEYPWNSAYAFAENDVIRAIDQDGLERYILSTDRSSDANGQEVLSRHLRSNPNKDQWNKGLIGHYDANNKLTIINDPNRLSAFDQKVFDYATNVMQQYGVIGGAMQMNANTDIGTREPAPFKQAATEGYRRGVLTTVSEIATTTALSRNLDVPFNLSEGPRTNGALYKDPARANQSIKEFAEFLLKRGVNRIDLGISTNYRAPEAQDEQYGSAENLLKARAATVAKSLSQFGITVNKTNVRYGEEPSVWGQSSTQIKVVSGWNVSQIPVQQKLLNGNPNGVVKPTGAAKSTFIPNSGQTAPKSKINWK